MLVVIAPEKDIKNESAILNQMFGAGLECFHLRKPSKEYDDCLEYLEQISPKYHQKVVVHSHHQLVNQFNLKGIHFTENHRLDCADEWDNYLEDLNMKGKTMSSSFHEPADILECKVDLDYHFLSPVFDSISKDGYKGRMFDVNHMNKQVLGMGGASLDNLEDFKRLGYAGVGVLGAIWKSTSPVEMFRKMSEQFYVKKRYE